MILCHGSNMVVEQPEILKPSHALDFGLGFYTTLNRDQSVDFAQKVVLRKGGSPVVNEYEIDGGLTETYVVSRDASAPLNRPTDGQAEVLVPGSITTELIKRIICRSQDDMSRVCMELRIVAGKLPEIVVSPLEFDDYEPSWQRERPGHWRR